MKVRNGNNITLIDDRYYNLMLRQKIVGVRPVYNPAGKKYEVTVSIACTADAVIAYRCNSAFAGIKNYVLQSGQQRNVTLASYSDFSMDIYVFDIPQYAIIKGTIALIIRNRNTGAKVFDSRGRYMKILGYMTVTVAANSGLFDTFNGSDKSPACVPLQPYLRMWSGSFDAGGSPVSESAIDLMQTKAVGNTIQAKIEEYGYKTGGAGGVSQEFYSGSKVLMFVDVTGF